MRKWNTTQRRAEAEQVLARAFILDGAAVPLCRCTWVWFNARRTLIWAQEYAKNGKLGQLCSQVWERRCSSIGVMVLVGTGAE
jgi:hypothetical protein